MSDFSGILSSVNQAIARRDGIQLSYEVALPLSQGRVGSVGQASLATLQRIRSLNVVAYCESNIADCNIGTMFGHRTLAMIHLVDDNLESAYSEVQAAYNAFLECFSDKDDDTTWLIPCLSTLSNSLRLIADISDTRAKNDNKNLRESLHSLTRGFTKMSQDRTPITSASSKRRGIFATTNVLLKVYFKLNTLQLCGKLINIVEGPGGIMDNLRLFQVSEVVTYKYYIGRLKMFEDKYEDARLIYPSLLLSF